MSDETAKTTEGKDAELIPIYVMGKRYDVPDSLTIMKALEYAGYKYIRGCGCRGGICGACGTVYRKPGDYHIRVGLACQTVVERDMYLTQIPFFPAIRSNYDFAEISADATEVHKLYPELFRCVACNACTKVCPMDVQVMDYVAAIKQGNLAKANELSFDCIQCGLCTSRCMAEMAQYHIAQMVRRIHGSKIAPRSDHLQRMVESIDEGQFDQGLDELKSMDEETMKGVYQNRQMEPHMSEEDWKPEDPNYL